MKILCLSKLAVPYLDGTTICVASLLRALMAAGHEVRLVTARDMPGLTPKPGPGWEGVGCPTVHVDLKPSSPATGVSRWTRKLAALIDPCRIPPDEDTAWIFAAEQALVAEIDTFAPDVVLTTDPRASHLAGMLARRRREFAWIASLDDPWDRRTMFERVPWYSMSHFYHRRAISRVAALADAFLFPSRRLAEFERQFSLGPWPSIVEVIPHLGTMAEGRAPREAGRFRMVHVGDLRPRGRADCLLPEALAAAAAIEPGLRHRLEIVFVGDVPDSFTRRMDTQIGDAFRWEPPCSYPSSLGVIASSDVNVIIERNSPLDILMVSKLADYAMVDAPILAIGPRAGNLPDLAAEGQCLHAATDDVQRMADHVLALYREWRSGRVVPCRHSALREQCRPETGARQFEALVLRIAERRSPPVSPRMPARQANSSRALGPLRSPAR